MTQSIIYSSTIGLSDVALVLSDSTVKITAKQQFLRIYQGTGVNLAFFDSAQAGLDWLKEQGLDCPQSDILSQLA